MRDHADSQLWPTLPDAPAGAPSSALAETPATTTSLPQVQRTWPAVLTLYVLAPFIAEMLTGSTPPLRWNNIAGIILLTGLYGSGAILARELVRRRGLSWGHLALLGVAYGALEEGISVQSWFNPTWQGAHDAARLFEVNWTFVLIFTTIHVTLSIMSSVVLVEALFPRLAARPWLSQKAFVGLTLWLALVVAWLFFTSGFLTYRGKGYDHPPVTYVIAPLIFLLALWLGTRRSTTPARASSGGPPRPAPHLWTLRLAAFGAALVVLVTLLIVPNLIHIALLPIGIVAGVDMLGVLLVRRWAHRAGWSAAHRLALTSGVMGAFIVAAPFFEVVLRVPQDTGLTLVNVLALGGLIWLAWRVKRLGNGNNITQIPVTRQ